MAYICFPPPVAVDYTGKRSMTCKAFIVGGLPEARLLEYATVLSNGASERPTIVVKHDPSEDNKESGIGSCEYPSLHYHGIVEYYTTRSDNDRKIQQFKRSIESHSEGYYKGTDVVNVSALLTYMQVPPRKLVFMHGDKELDTLIMTWYTITKEEVERMRLRKQKQREEQDAEKFSPNDIWKLSSWLTENDVQSKQQLFDVMSHHSDKDSFLKLYCKRSFDANLEKATYMVQQNFCSANFKVLSEMCEKKTYSDCYTPYESALIIREWAIKQGIDIGELVTNVVDWIDRRKPKINALWLEGEPNSGKSYLARSFTRLCKYYGELNQGTAGYAFMYQDCINKRIIMINEPYFDSAMIEQLKIVLEGIGTFVHVKSKRDDWLQPTPVVITSNGPIWRYAKQEEQAIRARLVAYENLTAQDQLKSLTRDLHPFAWMYILKSMSVAPDSPLSTCWCKYDLKQEYHYVDCFCRLCQPGDIELVVFIRSLESDSQLSPWKVQGEKDLLQILDPEAKIPRLALEEEDDSTNPSVVPSSIT